MTDSDQVTTGFGPEVSQRRLIPGLRSPFPMINYTSALLIEDPIAQKICASLDEVLAPVISVLDCYDSYLDAAIAPLDFVNYMCSWILVDPEVGWDETIVRKALAHANRFYELRGTAAGIEHFLKMVLKLEVTVEQTGSVTATADFVDPATWPEAPAPSLKVTVRSTDQEPVDMGTVGLVLQAGVPAHVDFTLTEEK